MSSTLPRLEWTLSLACAMGLGLILEVALSGGITRVKRARDTWSNDTSHPRAYSSMRSKSGRQTLSTIE